MQIARLNNETQHAPRQQTGMLSVLNLMVLNDKRIASFEAIPFFSHFKKCELEFTSPIFATCGKPGRQPEKTERVEVKD